MEESRRERKKRQTRQLIVETAMRLFAEQGYERTTVAQIAAAADVATKTFFNHFPSKEDVLLSDTRTGNAIALEVIAERRPDESVPDLLTRAYARMEAAYRADGPAAHSPALMELHTRLLTTVPALQAKALRLVFHQQKEIADALHRAYPDQLDPVSAAAVVGALVGATQAAALRSLEAGDTAEEFWAAMRRAVDIALHGLRTG
ncbi:TetR/AcrR family transcriptional regulator [Streptantibioticus cattleyicolor]|uniref:Putative transcriptional regulator, TetR family n=1 Tax=Streptantibioticus cattleyicolor (strain ATCC 35852 / DSM 46488 / JCM 4925 / NBRC 14057 / NRRL 8057) TaxID=1003195 RepID=F8JJX1_STREN|nr:TetR/AcrR family transcriptional regulator [Streptantibioticus cattleyicolor]AEW98597.1 putative transcriptional regulator, TetR family [Streptantibioticus cattleyicolor NRRL 8057 = DSM 46488]CCB72342.1 Transcriptional regulator, TetR family [Streptantibioticus cattleyicolor NRRL 8057 = DSM 46488]